MELFSTKPLKPLHIFFLGFIIGAFTLQLITHSINQSVNPSHPLSKSLVVIDPDNYIAVKYADKMRLVESLERYDQVILALNDYYSIHKSYPNRLNELIPEYLPQLPRIYIPSGEILHYALNQNTQKLPFTFYIYGHYPGSASMHGWFIKYCPIEQDLCGEIQDRHTTPLRINSRWIWVNSSAL